MMLVLCITNLYKWIMDISELEFELRILSWLWFQKPWWFYEYDNLPTAFTNQYGSLTYKIIGYLPDTVSLVSIAQKALPVRGNLNLSNLLEITEPITAETGIQKSCFSSKKAITTVFEAMNYHNGSFPGEVKYFLVSSCHVNCSASVLWRSGVKICKNQFCTTPSVSKKKSTACCMYALYILKIVEISFQSFHIALLS